MVADKEKIHSQIIYWVLNHNNISFSDKVIFLNDFLNLNLSSKIINPNIEVVTEYKSIDILIIIDGNIIAIENKLKSSEHSNQLNKYDEILSNDFSRRTINKYYLTLIDDVKKNGWVAVKYDVLKNSLLKIGFKNDTGDKFILSQYLQTLTNLNGVSDEFLNNLKNFKCVFEDGNKSKHKKMSKSYKSDFGEFSPTQKYISKFNLETILQKAYLINLVKSMKLEYDYKIEETRGNALIEYIIIPELSYNGNNYEIGVQFQKYTIKVNLVNIEYQSSKSCNNNYKFFRNYTRTKQWRFNSPKTKDYCSISKILDFDTIINKNKLKKEFEEAIKIARDLSKEYLV